ncbi:MAG: threonine synthase [Caldisphaera sp.]|uniref:threonine synthase n=1 Tax=Caldisphaera sp. TaxID=2060322 RepID=UPI000CC3BEEA|nr:MAG: threonine synthase [Caldisphaera sp.]PMP89174.1 MAG: threonine synthase [Caldisphaera sp.]
MRCLSCGASFNIDQKLIVCPICGGLLEIINEFQDINKNSLKGRGVWRYKELIPGNYKKIVSLNEGNTPLINSKNYENLYLKFEGLNPTGSFKDRGMTVAISSAYSLGYKIVVAASTGNTAASASAYSARAGLKTLLFLPKGKVAKGKMFQSILHGAVIVEVDGSFDNAMSRVRKLFNEDKDIYPVNSFNPWRLEGQKTIAYEIYEDIGSPDFVIVPTGNAGNIYAIWKGFKELENLGIIDKMPKMIAVQAEGASPIADFINKNQNEMKFVENPETVATAIRIGKPVNYMKAIKAIKDSKGTALKVSDDEILYAQIYLAREEGIGVEPASASTMAAYKKLLDNGYIDKKDRVVLILTGHALKDPNIMVNTEIHSVSQDNIEILINKLKI